MTQNITSAKKNFEEKLIEGLSAEGNIEGKINIKKSDILSYILLLNATNNNKFDESELNKIKFNIFKFIQLSDFNFNIMTKYDLYKQKYISDDDIQKLNAILNVLKNSSKISNSLKNFFDSMDKSTTTSKDRKLVITAKIDEINEIKNLSITQITSDYFHYVNGKKFLVVGKLDVEKFINYLADEYINEIIERIYVGTFKSDVKNLIDEIHKEGGDITVKDFIINKIISDAKIKAKLIEKKGRYKINDSNDKNIEILLSKNKSIFSYNLTNEIRNKVYDDNTTGKQPIFFNIKKDNTNFFIIFLNKLYRVFINDNIDQDTVKTNNFISYILYRIYYYYLNIVDNINIFDIKYESKILYEYKNELETILNIQADNLVDNDKGTSKITVLQKVLKTYNKFFDDLTTKIIELLNSYEKDNIFNVIYLKDTDVNKTQYFFSEFKKHIIATISSAESKIKEDVSLDNLKEDVILDKLSEHVYKYYDITLKCELYDSIYIYKDESLDYLYKLYEYKYNECCKKYNRDYPSFISSSSELEELFKTYKDNKEKFKSEFNFKINSQKQEAIRQRLSQEHSMARVKHKKRTSPNTRVAHSDMLGDIVDRNLTEVFDTIKSDNTRSDTNLYSEKESLLHIVEENLIDIFDTFKSDKTIRDKVDSSLLDIVEENLKEVFDTFNTRTTSEETDLTTSEPSLSETSSLDSTPRNRTEQESNIIPQKYEKIINNLENNEKYIFAVDNFADYIQVRYKVGYRMEDEAKAKAKDMDEDISLRSFNNYIIYIDNANKIIKKFKINRKYNLKYILKIIYKKYDDIIIVSKRDNIKNILYQYKKSNYINIIFIYKKPYGETEISQLENFEKIIDKKNQDKDDSTKLYYNKDYEIILKYFNDKKAASVAEITKRLKEGLATQSTGAMIVEKNTFEAAPTPEAPTAPEAAAPTPEAAAETETVAETVAETEAVAEITKRLKEGLATISTGAMIVEKNTFEAPAAPTPEAAAPTPEAAAPTPEAAADTKASNVANYHRISREIINEIFNMLKMNNKALIISETKYSDNNKDEKKINGVYTLHNDNETPLQYIYKSATSPNTIIYLTYRLNSIEPKYYISLTIKSDGNIVGYNLEFSLEHFTTLLLKDNKPYSFSDSNISFTINFQDNPNTETEDSLLDIVEGNLSNVFDTLNIKEYNITINNPNTETEDSLLDIVEGNLSNVFDTLNDNTDDDALKLIKFLINYHDINSNVSALNLIKFLINYHDINSNVSALNLIQFLINSHKN